MLQKYQSLSGCSFSNVRIFCFSPFYTIVKWISLGCSDKTRHLKTSPIHQIRMSIFQFMKLHTKAASRLFLSSYVPAGSLSVWACSSRNWTAEYFPFLSPPSCFLSTTTALMDLSLFVSWCALNSGFLLAELRWEGLRASWLCVQTSSLWSCRLKFCFHAKENVND